MLVVGPDPVVGGGDPSDVGDGSVVPGRPPDGEDGGAGAGDSLASSAHPAEKSKKRQTIAQTVARPSRAAPAPTVLRMQPSRVLMTITAPRDVFSR
ncbi:hypothetical protein GCM10007231_32440 [Nocardioides daphniae]|uniref:Uncharacterized protein n=1 Tax=Nocardioides daphniae TaxID=402297 RepID=A0ABQ1QL92_9ACTN|nr:hypothetical protein GCM10007231_32440 [Nocardioides daphniae]